MNIIVTGGGTGGHIYPALAIAEGAKKEFPNTKVLYIGAKNSLESKIVPNAGFKFRSVDVSALKRPIGIKSTKTIFKSLKSYRQSNKLIKQFKPDIVIGTGGFVCGPVVLAAAFKKIPTMIHEQNALPGFTNKLLGRFVNKVCLNFEVAKQYFNAEKVVLTGLPVREEIYQADKTKGIKALDLDNTKKTLLVTGGSQGAQHINQVMSNLWQPLIAEGIQIVHIVGPKNIKKIKSIAQEKKVAKNKNLKLLSYLNHMEHAIAAADLIVCRAGATFLAEVSAVGKGTILVPYPYAAGDHQRVNAQALVDDQAAEMILDQNLTEKSLQNKIEYLMENDKLRNQIAEASLQFGDKDALSKILKEIKNLLA